MFRGFFSVLVIAAIGVGGWWYGADDALLRQFDGREDPFYEANSIRNISSQVQDRVGSYRNQPAPRDYPAFEPRQRPRPVMRRPLVPPASERPNRFRRFRLRRR